MMNVRIMLIILLTASLAGNAAFLLTAFEKQSPRDSSIIEQLSLTPNQRSKFKTAERTFQNERATARKKMAEYRGTLADELGKETPSRQRLLGAAAGMANVQTDMRPKIIEHLLVLHSILTPEQRTRFTDAMHAFSGESASCPGAMIYPSSSSER